MAHWLLPPVEGVGGTPEKEGTPLRVREGLREEEGHWVAVRVMDTEEEVDRVPVEHRDSDGVALGLGVRVGRSGVGLLDTVETKDTTAEGLEDVHPVALRE